MKEKYPFVSVCQRTREPNAMELAPIAEAKPSFRGRGLKDRICDRRGRFPSRARLPVAFRTPDGLWVGGAVSRPNRRRRNRGHGHRRVCFFRLCR